MHDDLWQFAVTLYSLPGVEGECLQLQAQGGDVCLAIGALWLGTRGVAFTQDRLQAMTAVATPWQADVIKPLRALRQQWRASAQADAALGTLRTQLKKLELDAEQQLLQRLQATSQAWPGVADALTLDDWCRASVPPMTPARTQTLLCAAAGSLA